MMKTTRTQIPKYQRRYEIDAIRILAFAFLILYHCAMFYVVDWDWHIKSQYQSDLLQGPMIFLNQWRMPLLFVISGMAAFILFDKYGVYFIGPRLLKLGLPLVFGMFIVVAPQAYYELKANLGYEKGYFHFWLNYISFQPWPEHAFTGSDYGITWNHLWFLPYVMLYTIVFIPISLLLKAYLKPIQNFLNELKLYHWVLLPILPLMLLGWFVFPLFPEKTHALYNDWYNHGQSFVFFLCGVLLILTNNVWRKLSEHYVALFLSAVFCFIVFTLFRKQVIDPTGAVYENLFTLFIYLNRWLWILVVIALGSRFLNKPNRFFKYATSAIFSWYILHQTIIIVLGAWLSPLNLGNVIEPFILLLGTIVGCLLIHHYIILKLPYINVVFGVSEKKHELLLK